MDMLAQPTRASVSPEHEFQSALDEARARAGVNTDTWPKVEMPTEVLGGAHWLRLKMLKNSARKAIPALSENL
jgi:hypothetical protein